MSRPLVTAAVLLALVLGSCSSPSAPSHHWLVDAQGRPYYLARIPRTQAQRRPDGSVVTDVGIPLVIARQDSKYFYYKVFDSSRLAEPTSSSAPVDVSASYHVTTKTSTRLRFFRLGSGLPGTGQWRNTFDVHDMNGDGIPDIVTTSPRKEPGPPRIYLGDRHGKFHRWADASFPVLRYDYGAAVAGDLNGDGHADIVLGMHLLGVTALLGDGHGHFTTDTNGLDAPPSSFSSQALAITDWNGDGEPDVVAVGEGPSPTGGFGSEGLVVYLNDGHGNFVRHAGSSDTFSDAIATTSTEVVTGSSVLSDNEILFGHDGSRSALAIRPRAYVFSVATGDLDGDGRTDIAVGYVSFEGDARTGIDVFLRRAHGFTRRTLAVASGTTSITSLATGDLDGDGHTDLVALTGHGDTVVFLGDGHGSLTRERRQIPRFSGSCQGAHVALADVNGDHRDDIVESFADDDCSRGGGFEVWSAKR